MTTESITRAARRLMAVRNPHRDLAAAIDRLIDRRCADPLASIPVVSIGDIVRDPEEDDHQPALAYHPPLDLMELPDTHNTRPPSLVDLYGGNTDIYNYAMRRLTAATVRRGHLLHNPRLCWGCDGEVNETTLACDCYTPNRTSKENA